MAKVYDKYGRPIGFSDATGLPSHQSKGLGDTVEKFTKATGIDKLAKKNIIHANKAGNLKSKLAKYVTSL